MTMTPLTERELNELRQRNNDLLGEEIAAYNKTHDLDTLEKRLRALAERIDAARGRVRVLADVNDTQGWGR